MIDVDVESQGTARCGIVGCGGNEATRPLTHRPPDEAAMMTDHRDI
jgi:hypothetical protein